MCTNYLCAIFEREIMFLLTSYGLTINVKKSGTCAREVIPKKLNGNFLHNNLLRGIYLHTYMKEIQLFMNNFITLIFFDRFLSFYCIRLCNDTKFLKTPQHEIIFSFFLSFLCVLSSQQQPRYTMRKRCEWSMSQLKSLCENTLIEFVDAFITFRSLCMLFLHLLNFYFLNVLYLIFLIFNRSLQQVFLF